MAVDSHGDLYVVLEECTIFDIAAVDHTQFAKAMQHGDIYRIGGGYRTGSASPANYCAFWDPYSRDGAPALTSAIGTPYQLAVDPGGNVFYSDPLANRIREISNENATQFNDPKGVTRGRFGDFRGVRDAGRKSHEGIHRPATTPTVDG